MLAKFLSGLAAAAGLVVIAGLATAAPTPTIVPAGTAKFEPASAPMPSTLSVAVLSGDPKASGSLYTIRIKIPDGGKIPPHTHGKTEIVTVMSGTFMVGLGKTFDETHMKALDAGSYASVPPGVPHYAMAKGETIVQVSGIGPEETMMVK